MFHQIISIKHDLNVLLLIDPQIDFCHKEGALYVPNAENDCKRIARFIREKKHDIDEIFVTLDSHHKKHIAHGAFWSDSPTGTGNMPGPFTVINNEENARLVSIDEKTGEKTQWYPRDLKFTNYGFEYTHNLQKKGRPLIIWPDHCLIGTYGHGVADVIQEALLEWNEAHIDNTVKFIHKGMNLYTEMYSAIEADVPVPSDYRTKRNTELLAELEKARKLFVCGEALSHCVNYTVRDIVQEWQKDGLDTSKIVLLDDCASNVTGFEAAGAQFITDMKKEGVTLTKAQELCDDEEKWNRMKSDVPAAAAFPIK